MPETRYYTTVESPYGPVLLAGHEAGLTRANFSDGTHPLTPEAAWRRERGPLLAAAEQVEAYFAGQLREFDLALDLHGTAFQIRVWEALLEIPFGQTTTYGKLAGRIGKPTAARAVGAANGSNPIPLIVPCHRVIGADGSLTGYGEGLPIKAGLLALEGAEGVKPDNPGQRAQLPLWNE